METADIKRCEAQAQQLVTGLETLADKREFEEFIKIIHGPGWTTIAEAIFVTGIMDSMQTHATALHALKKALLAGSRAVGR